MTQFEFFMTFYGLLLGLSVAELFSGFARIIQDRTPPRVGIILPMLGLIAVIEFIATFHRCVDIAHRRQHLVRRSLPADAHRALLFRARRHSRAAPIR